MNQRADRRWSRHGVRQPHEERNLRRLARHAKQNEERYQHDYIVESQLEAAEIDHFAAAKTLARLPE